jgi:hypothetical protein
MTVISSMALLIDSISPSTFSAIIVARTYDSSSFSCSSVTAYCLSASYLASLSLIVQFLLLVESSQSCLCLFRSSSYCQSAFRSSSISSTFGKTTSSCVSPASTCLMGLPHTVHACLPPQYYGLGLCGHPAILQT